MENSSNNEKYKKSDSNDGKLTIMGYGDKKSLSKDEVNRAVRRINSYRGVNFCVSAPGKLVLFGEYGEIFGTPAVAASINRRTYLRLTENKVHNIFAISMRNINFSYHTSFDAITKFIVEDIPAAHNYLKPLNRPINCPGDINHDKFLEKIKENLEKYFQPIKATGEQMISFCVFLYLLHGIFYKEDLKAGINWHNQDLLSPLIIDINSELSLGAGIGSSASFCVCITAALLHYKNIRMYGRNSAEEITFSDQGLKLISEWAFNAEKIFHGQPSGLDTAIATYGSFIELVNANSKRKFIEISDPPKFHVVIIDSGIKRNTIDLINGVIMRLYCNPEPFEDVLNALHQVCDKALSLVKDIGYSQVRGLDSSEFQLLLELVTVNQGLLYSLGVSHVRLQEICSICSEFNLNAKQTGAGGGGYAFILIPKDFDKDLFSRCVNKLNEKNFVVHNIELDEEGVRLEDLTQLRRV